MKILGFSVAEFVSGLVGLGIAVMFGVKLVKEFLAQRKGLAPNPERCHAHEEKLAVLDMKCAVFTEKFESVETSLEKIEQNTSRLLELHLKP